MKFRNRLFLSLMIVALSGIHSENGYLYLENGILDYSNIPSSSPKTGNESKGKKSVYFSKKGLNFKIPLSYNVVERLRIENSGEKEVSIKVNSKAEKNLLYGVTGEGGDSFIKIPLGNVLSLPVRFFAQDTLPGTYSLENSISDEQGNILDTIRGTVEITKPDFKIETELLKKTPLVQQFRFKNKGDTLANFSIRLKNSDSLRMEPSVDHYLFPKDGSLEIAVYTTNRLEKNQSASFHVSSSGIEKEVPFLFEAASADSVEMVSLDPIVRLRNKDWYCTNRPIIHMSYTVPYFEKKEVQNLGFTSKFSWLTSKGEGSDTNGNDKADHWTLTEKGNVIMAGDDYDEDGEIDFFREQDSENRTLNRAYFKKDGKWFETNIVDLYLISSYLPFNDGANVQPHDLEVLINDVSFAQEKQIIPTGSRLRRIPLHRFNENQINGYSENRITVRTSHLPEANYQVNAENTLLIFYSTIQIPVVSRKKLDLNIKTISENIAEEEKKAADEPNEVKKEASLNLLSKLKQLRDQKLKEIEKFFQEHSEADTALKLTGVQYRGADLAVYGSDLSIQGNGISGKIRNMGYESLPYTVSLFQSSEKGYTLVETQEGRNLPPFAKRNFRFSIKNFSDKKRKIYKITISPKDKKKEELVTSNNQAHLIVGKENNAAELKKEMVALASEMGLTNDQVTLVSKPAIPEFSLKELENVKMNQIEFPWPQKLKKEERKFILE
ncbi:hypothetical protein [Leptospira interrogans]|uniref:hypothetical protein n=1 Tax=Leptospira interrogans TaxID=173 RepID=UPI000773AD66|nr:hypothetical protein [Leptospira interrogans]